ncbi:hypothetical protein ARMSODRAFT_780320 [Armillaria solidipes]|uniref:A-kinase anchor protein 7-like phosphoesterase domain-containing protein n=1 Tax=Armillaria solidipes TaxID=1076256 RepID=A0A2H3BRJ4_9AGAR|nr:hypothetical protein ARMSODRAFT_780320 [Armillaria solidipes]
MGTRRDKDAAAFGFGIECPAIRSGSRPSFQTMMARPTHFLSIPLGQVHPTLCSRIADFRAALSLPPPNSTLLAGPQRVHLTLGVIALTPESLPTDIDLLYRLPTLLPLTTAPPTVTLDTLDVLRRESRRRAHVLWVGPSQPEPLFSQIYQIFRDEGFITDTRPLKLHMTLMNSTYRRPRTRRPRAFEYDSILRQARVLGCFGVQESKYAELPMSVSMGSYDAPRVHLCEMTSWDTDGAYVS